MTEQSIEQQIVAKNLTAPRLTPDAISAAIKAEAYYVFPGTTVTVCCLTLQNGFCCIGESACVSPENFDADIGKQVAKEDARRKIWALEGYLLCRRLAEEREAGG